MLFLRRTTQILIVLWVIFLIYYYWLSKSVSKTKLDFRYLLLIWWKPMVGLEKGYTSTRYCGVHKCIFTSDREELKKASALLYYGSEFSVDDLPLPRLPKHVWALLHEESPRNVPYMPHTSFLRHFNFTSTFSRYSDLPLTTLYLHDTKDLTTPAYLVAVGDKTRFQKSDKLAPIVFLQSDCDTSSERDTYVKELMRYIDVDSYGACLHNRELPKSLTEDYLNQLYSPELYRFLGRYKFILAYENGVCNDYITEKFWRPLVVGSIPIYFGSPSIKDWQPNEKSIIHISDFSSPKALAEYINSINANDSEYNTFLQHKYNLLQPVTNRVLKQELLWRDYSPSKNPNLMGIFECFVCSQLHQISNDKHQMATASHYDCPFPPLYPPMSSELSSNYNAWRSIMAMGKCQAELINELLQKNIPYTKQEFQKLLNDKVTKGMCNGFISRRGHCAHIYSDCGTTFVCANKELQILHNRSRSSLPEYLVELLASNGTTWHFIPPATPHFGGLWEAGVKSTKHHLRRVLKDQILTYEELSTLLAQIEFCLNSRPLCPISSDPTDQNALTPAALLGIERTDCLNEGNLLDANYDHLCRWKKIEQLKQHFWQRWLREYVCRLQARPKWTSQQTNIKVGDLVLLYHENTPTGHWPLARILDVHPGTDGIVRVVTVFSKGKYYKRPVTKICLLPTNENLLPSSN